jgi:hypothetical protein
LQFLQQIPNARALLENLESYLRGNRDAMSIVAVPSPE